MNKYLKLILSHTTLMWQRGAGN